MVQAASPSPPHSQDLEVNLANHRSLHHTGSFQQTQAQDKSDSLATIIYENYDDNGEFFDYEYSDTDWFPQSPVEERRRPSEKKFIENKKSHFENDYRPKYHRNS